MNMAYVTVTIDQSSTNDAGETVVKTETLIHPTVMQYDTEAQLCARIARELPDVDIEKIDVWRAPFHRSSFRI